MFHAINALMILHQFVVLMEETIKMLVNALARVIVKNIQKEDAQWKNLAPDVLVYWNLFVVKKELLMIIYVIYNVLKINS